VIPHDKFASICSAARLKRKVAETGPIRTGHAFGVNVMADSGVGAK
jgi:hypothetical protein